MVDTVNVQAVKKYWDESTARLKDGTVRYSLDESISGGVNRSADFRGVFIGDQTHSKVMGENFAVVSGLNGEPNISLHARSDGQVAIGKNIGFDCKLATEAMAAVENILNVEKVTTQAVDSLRQFVAKAPNPVGKNNKCSSK